MSVSAVIQRLEPILTEIEMNSIQSDVHGSNARMANTAAALSYLFTSNSKNSTVRTVGQVAIVGGLLYGNSQRNQANAYQQKNAILISQAIGMIELEGIPVIRQERNVDLIRRFLQINLTLGQHLDNLVTRFVSGLTYKGHLGKSNIHLLYHVNNIDLISYKLRLNHIYRVLDSGKQLGHIEKDFVESRQYLNIDKIAKEGLIARIIIISLVVLGFVLIQRNEQAGSYVILAGLLFWLGNHFFPFFPETRKLRTAVNVFLGNLKGTLGIRGINFK
jgi:hypothetical protein